MRLSFHPRMVNGPFDDPGVYVPFVFRKQAMLFDMGDLGALSTGDLLKISQVFITHTHMDHFIGFDQLLRLLLGRNKTVDLFGPPGFIENVTGKLNGYTWNLVESYAESLTLQVTEIHPRHSISRIFACRDAFRPSGEHNAPLSSDTVYENEAVVVRAALLDHQIPCLGYAVEEKFHVNILKARLDELELDVGPWLTHFKNLILKGADPDTDIAPAAKQANPAPSFKLGFLAERITQITPGQKIAYISDVIHTPENEERIVRLAQGCDTLFIEAAFLEADREIAKAKYHLTARQAGILARRAGAKQMLIFHHSPRYSDQGPLLESEARRAFEQG